MPPLRVLENPIYNVVRRACSCSGGTPLWASNGDFMTLRKLLTLEVLALLTLLVNIVHLGSRGSHVPITLGTLAVILCDIRHIILWLHQWVCYWCFESTFWCLLCLNSTCRSKGICDFMHIVSGGSPVLLWMTLAALWCAKFSVLCLTSKGFSE